MNSAVAADSAALAGTGRLEGRRLSTQLLVAELIGDALVVFLALAFSSWLRFETVLARYGHRAGEVAWGDYLGHVAVGTALFLVLLPHRAMYDRHALLRARATTRIILRTAVRWLVAFTAFSWLMRPEPTISRMFVAVAFVTTTGLFVGWRYALHQLVASGPMADRLRQRLLFVGWSPPAADLVRAIEAERRPAYEIAGYVAVPGGAPPGDPPAAVDELGELARLAEVVRERAIDLVVLADPDLSGDQTIALATLCEKEMVEFKVIPTCFQILLSCLSLETMGQVPVLGIDRLPLDAPAPVLLKQAIDFLGGVAGLILSAPAVVLFGLLVWLEDPGPIIYRQRRLGQHGRPFWIYKIRSMREDAEQAGVGWTVRDDPRRLRIGRFMRRWNIDELPQFWNVLRGDMSLVGPRPERPELIRQFKDRIPHYNARHSIKPGLTGWAQINGFRGDTDLNERIRCDLYYIENWSLLLDFQILALTPFRHKNAG